MPDIPDLTSASWQARRTDAQLMASITEGKGSDMPPFSEDITKEQARGLVVFVRSLGRAGVPQRLSLLGIEIAG